MRAWLILSLLLLLSGPARAQGWQLSTGDDGSYFYGSISAPSGMDLRLLCGERSPRGISPQATGNMEPEISAPGTLRLYLSRSDIGEPAAFQPARGDVVIVAGPQGFRLPSVTWNELYETWETAISAADPVLAAMGGSPHIELRSSAGVRRADGAGFSTAARQLAQYCQSMFASIGKPWYGSPPAAAGGAMRAAAEAAVSEGCGGPAERGPAYLLAGNIDGDGEEDVVLDWSEVACRSQYARPFCGASHCAADVFLSAGFPLTGRPETLLAQGVRLQPLSNGNMAIAIGAPGAACGGYGGQGCSRLFYWTGAELAGLD